MEDLEDLLGAADWKECPADRNLTNLNKSNK